MLVLVLVHDPQSHATPLVSLRVWLAVTVAKQMRVRIDLVCWGDKMTRVPV